ncbi:PIN domain-containing protein [Actinoplanes sp. NEAU-A12]|uniref:PIN domain-containing protein n=1 Tax=Actinoplanes sandaracinus TaxID=3045177 RepID=A0ABT6WU06_9ACTN|nr:PIN domain-containing protein [Actinoplanes sandaracinus]MDI6103184.1 PIN domain-containing protein [Actinoplanes sandaracinus]
MRRIVFDTDVASAHLKDRMPPVLAAKVAGFEPVITFVGRAELAKWTYKRDWSTWRRARLARWLAACPLLPGEDAVADMYGMLSASAESRGRPRPMNDMWIAACCLVHGLPLATLNVKDFDEFRIHHGLTLVTA